MMRTTLHLKTGRLMWKTFGLKFCNLQTRNCDLTKGDAGALCLLKLFPPSVPHAIHMTGTWVKSKSWEEKMPFLFSIKLNWGKIVASSILRAYTPMWIADPPKIIMRRLIGKIQNPLVQCISPNLCSLVLHQTGSHFLGHHCADWCHLKVTVED